MTRLPLLTFILLPLALTACAEPPALPVEDYISAKLAPPAGKTLLIVGQDIDAIADYTAGVWQTPAGLTTYTGINMHRDNPEVLAGLETATNYGAGDIHAQHLVDGYPESALVIGLSIVDRSGLNLERLADGTYDEHIDRLGDFIKASERPVFLRIGYEFDGQWNRYEPQKYIPAFQHIVDRLRETGVDNFASVWQSASYVGGTFMNRPFTDWYPGDEYVDWMGLSYFIYDKEIHDAFLAFAREHNKPVMVAEAAPQGYDIEDLDYSDPSGIGSPRVTKTQEEIWQEWYAPFFEYVHENQDVIRAVAYINVDWNSQAMWTPGGGNGYWGDSRVQANPYILEQWLAEIDSSFWMHGSNKLFNNLND